MRTLFARLVGPSGLALCVAIGGCGGGATDDRPRREVSGTVTLDGQPLARGTIQFQPTSPNEGVAAAGEIKEGKFAIPRDQGPVPGDYIVSISSVGSSAPPPPGPPGAPTPPPPDAIPARYNAESTLSAKVEADGPNTFEFSMKK
jgi:hypothetical protein